MAKIKFNCPECTQRIGMEEAAVGSSGDCPTCGSSLRIPKNEWENVEVLVRRTFSGQLPKATDLEEDMPPQEGAIGFLREELEELRSANQAADLQIRSLRADHLAMAAERDAARRELEALQRELKALRDWVQQAEVNPSGDVARTAPDENSDLSKSIIADLGRERDLLERTILEREELARRVMEEAQEAKMRFADILLQKDRALEALRSELENARRNVHDHSIRVAAVEKAAEPHERLHQIDAELERGKERLRALKNDRFKLRESLAAEEAMAKRSPEGDLSRLDHLRRSLRDLIATDTAIRKVCEGLLTERSELAAMLAPGEGAAPEKVAAASEESATEETSPEDAAMDSGGPAQQT